MTQKHDHKEFMEKQKLKWWGILGDWGYAVPIIRHTTTANPAEVADTAGPPTPPIKMPSPTANETANCVYVMPMSLQNVEPHLTPVSDLSRDHNIVLAMGSQSEIESNLCQTIDMSPLYCTLGNLTEQTLLGNMVMDVGTTCDGRPSARCPFNLKSKKDLTQCFDKYSNTFKLSVLKTITIQLDITWKPFILDHILPYFKPVIGLLSCLHDAVIVPLFFNDCGNISHRAAFTHDMFVANIIETLSHLGPDAWVPVMQGNNNKNYSNPEMKVEDKLDKDELVDVADPPLIPQIPTPHWPPGGQKFYSMDSGMALCSTAGEEFNHDFLQKHQHSSSHVGGARALVLYRDKAGHK
ncbi:hypothetical protein EDC04DRAFT_2604841 [Pisolithus marmoratus]|nr:hypothetical protein EDC04DRAFT_2604841 [Pisolithus marmoratus]